jgi:hypothetical protein
VTDVVGDGARGSRRAGAALLALLAALGALLHAPWLDRPFGPMEINGANYFGVFARNWERLGFQTLRGVPLGFRDVDSIAQGSPYWTHPPGFAWLSAALGSAEWQIRLPTALGHAAAAVLAFALLRAALPPIAAALGGLAMLAAPVLAFYSLASYENAVLPLGLLAWLALRNAHAASTRRTWRGLLVAACLIGPWMDWAFGFFCIAMLPLVASRDWRRTVRRLALPWCASLASLLAVVGWTAWAAGAPSLPATDFGELLRGLLRGSGGGGAPALARHVENLRLGFSLPVLALALAGLPFFARAAPRLALAMLVAGMLNAAVFPANTAGHVFYWAYLAPLVAGGVAGLARIGGRRRAWIGAALASAAIGWGAARVLAHFRAADTTFFRDQGALITGATTDGARRFVVLANYAYGYYVRSPHAAMGLPALTDPQRLEELRTRGGHEAWGVRYVLTELEGAAGGGAPLPRVDPALKAYLERFPSPAAPALERRVTIPGYGSEATLRCRVFALRE